MSTLPFLLAGGDPNWVPREPVLFVDGRPARHPGDVMRIRTKRGRPKLKAAEAAEEGGTTG